MKSQSAARGIGLVFLVLFSFINAGCEVIEAILDDSSPSSKPRSNLPANPQPQPVLVGYNATYEITRLACYDGEEDDYITSSGQDEITFIYSITETDQYGRAVRSSSLGWGPYDMVAGDNYGTKYFEDLTLTQIPVGHGLITTVTITEIEDYSKAQRVMGKINKYARYVEFANTFNPEPNSKTGIEIVGRALYYAGVALDIVDWADDDDTLGDHVDVGDANLVTSTLVNGGYLHNGWVFSGSNNTDHYEYEVNFIVHLKPIYR